MTASRKTHEMPMPRLTAQDVAWIICESVTGFRDDDSPGCATVRVKRYDESREHVLDLVSMPHGLELRFDGQPIDVGDDFVSYVATIDEITEQGFSEPYND